MRIEFYESTERTDDVMEKSEEYSYGELNDIPNKVQAITYLARVYMEQSSIPLNKTDYRNLHSIIHIICLPNFGLGFQPQRTKIANEHIEEIQNDKVNLKNLIDNLLITNKYI